MPWAENTSTRRTPERRMARTLHERLTGALQERSVWEERNRIWYEMRHDGLKRRNKPFPRAADLHMPIADNAVEKLKPFYVNSIFSRQRLASFTTLGAGELATAGADASDALDWTLRNESNYEVETGHLIDLMLTYSGKIMMKIRWDMKANYGSGGVVFEAIDPLFFIPQKGGDNVDTMDYFCHIRQTTVAKYLRQPLYTRKDEEFVNAIKGGEKQEAQWKEQEKASREGLTWSRDEDEIVLWEAYERVEQGWRVTTYSPSAPKEPVREPFILPWKWRGEPF